MSEVERAIDAAARRRPGDDPGEAPANGPAHVPADVPAEAAAEAASASPPPSPTLQRDDEIRARFDLALVERARAGDLDAFNQLVLRHQDQLYALVYRLVPDRDQAADVVQEAFFSAYRNLGSFRGGSVRSWLSKIAVNGAMDLQRARRRRPSQPYPELEDESWQPPADPTDDPDARAIAAERTRALSLALASIGEDQRAAIVLYDVEGYDYAEIAQIAGVSVGTVKSRIHRGRLALRERLAGSRELFRG